MSKDEEEQPSDNDTNTNTGPKGPRLWKKGKEHTMQQATQIQTTSLEIVVNAFAENLKANEDLSKGVSKARKQD